MQPVAATSIGPAAPGRAGRRRPGPADASGIATAPACPSPGRRRCSPPRGRARPTFPTRWTSRSPAPTSAWPARRCGGGPVGRCSGCSCSAAGVGLVWLVAAVRAVRPGAARAAHSAGRPAAAVHAAVRRRPAGRAAARRGRSAGRCRRRPAAARRRVTASFTPPSGGSATTSCSRRWRGSAGSTWTRAAPSLPSTPSNKGSHGGECGQGRLRYRSDEPDGASLEVQALSLNSVAWPNRPALPSCVIQKAPTGAYLRSVKDRPLYTS